MIAYLSSRFGKTITSLVFPGYCPECSAEVATNVEWACDDCWNRLSPAGRGLWSMQNVLLERIFVAFHYNDLARTLVHQMKFYGREDIAGKLGRLAAEQMLLGGVEWPVEAIVPVPLHPVRIRERGYDQNLSIARGVSEITGLPVCTDLVRRVRHTSPQSRLSDGERLVNLRDAFEPVSSSSSSIPETILFVDDVIHTGATIIGCIEALKRQSQFTAFGLVACG